MMVPGMEVCSNLLHVSPLGYPTPRHLLHESDLSSALHQIQNHTRYSFVSFPLRLYVSSSLMLAVPRAANGHSMPTYENGVCQE